MTSQPRKPNPRGSGEQLRSELVAATRELLLPPQEPSRISLRAVARAVGVSPTAVYLHFASVEELVEAVHEDQDQSLRDALGSLDSPPKELALRYVRWGLANRGGYQLLFESADRTGRPVGPGNPGWDMIESLAGQLAEMLSIEPEAATTLAIRAWQTLHGLVSLRIHKAALPWPTTIETEVDAILEAFIRPPKG